MPAHVLVVFWGVTLIAGPLFWRATALLGLGLLVGQPAVLAHVPPGYLWVAAACGLGATVRAALLRVLAP